MRSKTLIAFLLALSISAVSWAQDPSTVKGIVKDDSGNPLAGASIVERKNPANGVTTDENGAFTIKLKDRNSKLLISATGFDMQTVSISGENILVALKKNDRQMDDVVVIGYQSVVKKKTTAAISSISGKELANLPAPSFDQMLQGRLGGIIVQNFTGEPGVAPILTVRGNSAINRDFNQFTGVSSPLILVDGIQQPNIDYDPTGGTGTNFLTGINPNDIEKIDVLKDAGATAIYGSRGANGVILVTTKRWRTGAPQISVSTNVGLVERPATDKLLIGAEERRQKFQIIQAHLNKNRQDSLNLLIGSIPLLLTDSLNPALNGNTDWEGLFFRTGVIRNTNVSVSGGTGNQSYNVSLGYFNEDGIVKATGFQRYTGRFNYMTKMFNDRLEINPILSFAFSERQRGAGRTDGALPFGNNSSYRLPASYIVLAPENEEALLKVYKDAGLDENKNTETNFNLNLNYAIRKNIRFSSQSGFQQRTAKRNQSRPSILNNNNGNSLSLYNDNSQYYNSNNFLTFSLNPINRKHDLVITAGQGIEFYTTTTSTAFANRGANDFVNTLSGFDRKNIISNNSINEYGTLSLYAQASYNYEGKYLFTVAAKRDASSTFGADSKWGTFPAVSAGWIVSEEKFFSNEQFLTFLKFRGSWGLSGNDIRSRPYLQYNQYLVNGGAFSNGNNGTYNGNNIVIPNFNSGAAQKDLTWEKSNQINIGMDMELKGGKYSLSADVYNRDNTDQIFDVALPVTSGYFGATTNAIGVRNYGLDLQLSARPLNTSSPLQWTTQVVVNFNDSRIINLPNSNRDIYSNFNVLTVNRPINAFYLFQSNGIFSSETNVPIDIFTGQKTAFYRNFGGTSNYFGQGDSWLIDQDGDNLVNLFQSTNYHPDKLTIGNPNPKFTGGFTNTFRYKNIVLNVHCTYTFKRDVLNVRLAERFNSFNPGDFEANTSPDLTKYDMWLKAGDKTKYPLLPIYQFLGNGRIGTYTPVDQTLWLDRGDFFRVKVVTLSYEFGNAMLKKRKLSRFRIYATADNLWLWKASKEIPEPENANLYGLYSGSGYPLPRKLTIGFDLNF